MDNIQNGKTTLITGYLFSMIRWVLCQNVALEPVRLQPEEFDALLKLARKHEVRPMVAYGLLQAGGLTKEQEQRCRELLYRNMVHRERMEKELHRTCDLLERAGIAYMPLKGAVIRSFYPEPWMRTSGDVDILVKDADRAAKVLTQNGYQYKVKGSHDITVISPLGIHFELHFQLIETDVDVNNLLEQVWEYAIIREGSFHYEMTPELFYFYHIAHMAKHMLNGGCGIRFFTDIWLLNRKMSMNKEKTKQLLQKGGLAAFAVQAERLSQVWFSDCQPDPLLLDLEDYILNGGVFGSKDNIVKLRRTQTASTVQFLIGRVFPRYDQIVLMYPTAKKYPILLPYYWVKRWLDRLMNRRKAVAAVQELALFKRLDDDAVDATKRLFQSLELL